jgi:arginase
MAEAAALELPYPETAVVAEETLDAQTEVLASSLPERPLVLGGCCCAHVGAAKGLAARVERLGVVWLDAHGDLNTPETSPSGNLWGMPLRMIVDGGPVSPGDLALIGARSLDPGEVEFIERTGIDGSLDRALDGVDAVYVALDVDVLDPSEIEVLIPEPDGPSVAEVEEILRDVVRRAPLAGIGVTGNVPSDVNEPVVRRLLAAAGL